MAALAEALKAWAWTVSGLVISPLASTLMRMSLRVPRPLATIASMVTSSPLSKRSSSDSTFTGWVCVRNISKGIDFFMCGPRSLRIRMWIGIWPPSKRARSLAPERDPAPLWPRPEVLRGLRLLGAGLSVCSPKSVIDLHQVAHAMQHPARLGGVLDVDRVADLAQAQRFQRSALLRIGPVR